MSSLFLATFKISRVFSNFTRFLWDESRNQGFRGTWFTHSNVDPECNHYVPPLRLRLTRTLSSFVRLTEKTSRRSSMPECCLLPTHSTQFSYCWTSRYAECCCSLLTCCCVQCFLFSSWSDVLSYVQQMHNGWFFSNLTDLPLNILSN